jgi:predicted alpha/beta hydrolase family esterase
VKTSQRPGIIDLAQHDPENPRMSRQVLFVQGAGESVHDTWDDKLVASLERELGDAYAVVYPRMPDEADPHYAVWKAALLKELGRLDEGAILVGHSIGGAFLLHALAEQPPKRKFGALFMLAAPFIGDGGWPSEEIGVRPDLAARLPAGLPIILYHGTDDTIVPFAHLKLYAKAIPRAIVRVLPNRDHQLGNDLREIAQDIESPGIRNG